MGFQVECGPVGMFISRHNLPKDMKFVSTSTPVSYVSDVSDEQPTRIVTGTEVRVRVAGTHVDVGGISVIGTMKDDFLGVISDT